MPASLIRLYITASSNLTVSDNVRRFVATVTAGMVSGGTTTIPDISFADDNGNAVVAGGLPLPPAGGYYQVYINGVLQQGGLSSLATTALTVSAALTPGYPVVLEVDDFSGSSVNTTINT